MRLAVMSDSHGLIELCRAVVRAQPDADLFIHLGDGYDQVERLRMENPTLPILAVRGNCDFCVSDTDSKLLSDANGKRILYTHGHRYDVKFGLSLLRSAAREQRADIVLFGHTHVPFHETIDGVEFINPGCLSAKGGARYVVVDILDDGQVIVTPKIAER